MRRIGPVLASLLLLIPLLALTGVAPIAADHLHTNASASTTAALNLRSGPGLGDGVLRVIPEGARVFIAEGPVNGHWYRATYDGAGGYASGDFLAQDALFLALDPEEGAPGTAVTIYGSGADPGGRVRVLAVTRPAAVACAAARGADPLTTVTADSAGRFSATHTPQRLSAAHAGVTYVAEVPGAPDRWSAPVCFTFTERQSRFFPETGYAVSGRFLDYWERNGGLAQFGYPLTATFHEESLTDGRVYRVQYFERQRFELHPENAAPYDVLIGLMGYEALPGQAAQPFPRVAPATNLGCAYYEPTGHNLCAPFRDHRERHGGLARYGYPIGEEYRAALPDGRVYTIQYFERARLEWHPEHQGPYAVLLGHLGREVLQARYGAQWPTTSH